ncbi:hypothetical protein Lser_V15G23015 [Lactuca serriola]
MWIVVRKSGNSELYRDSHEFSSFTRIDLTEFSRPPFTNLTDNPQVNQFKHLLEEQVKRGFPSMPTAESVIFEHPDVIDRTTDKPLQVVMWHATKQVKQFPVLQVYQDRSLDIFEDGIDEDPICGSAHCALAAYWSDKLGKFDFLAYQASPRSGILDIHLDKKNQRVLIRGKAITVMEGSLLV